MRMEFIVLGHRIKISKCHKNKMTDIRMNKWIRKHAKGVLPEIVIDDNIVTTSTSEVKIEDTNTDKTPEC